ncbi:50S ribosomal protein L17 [Pseudothermotoga thermarum]|uniref:50S ribosomal protein L17 n=1 Tax=Pseudothermotoga thermarum DSM 5069 TaxID=688269 RepID=F7YX37_9THEM|nr:50S ribosomal protein L17 [Pseudothermotoga thermarum]AEH50800.1 LSU ribosomal protein L17P [Pseudothermotoga thermarum DSM 5069]
MRHRMLRTKIGHYKSHGLSIIRNQMRELIEHGSIITTVKKAKVVRIYFEKLMTKAIKANQASDKATQVALRRQIYRHLQDRRLVNKLVDEIAKEVGRTSGFTRIVRIGTRRGDAAEMALIQIVTSKEE